MGFHMELYLVILGTFLYFTLVLNERVSNVLRRKQIESACVCVWGVGGGRARLIKMLTSKKKEGVGGLIMVMTYFAKNWGGGGSAQPNEIKLNYVLIISVGDQKMQQNKSKYRTYNTYTMKCPKLHFHYSWTSRT